ncbi:neurotensin/neuromedin N [Osmerus eperlanus]|uniref:neurotensin/neuromedin N n=1 Tax=Osmerus eperlanus TaxID=29151 RepID=UPI002E13131C
MWAQVACILLLCFTCGGLCSDVDQEQRAIEEELLSSLFTSKIKQNKQSAPYWQVSLINLCKMVTSLSGPWQKAWDSEEESRDGLASLPEPLEYLNNLQHICRVIHPREERLLHESQDYLDPEQNSDNPLKRKSPYILKRQAHTAKTRRPYILKRSALY